MPPKLWGHMQGQAVLALLSGLLFVISACSIIPTARAFLGGGVQPTRAIIGVGNRRDVIATGGWVKAVNITGTVGGVATAKARTQRRIEHDKYLLKLQTHKSHAISYNSNEQQT